MQAENNKPVTYGEWGQSLNNVHAGAKWTAYLSLLTPEERRHAETLSGEKLGEYVNSLNLEQRARDQNAANRQATAESIEQGTPSASASDSGRGRLIAAQVTGNTDYAKGVQHTPGGNRFDNLSALTGRQKETITRYAQAGDFASVEHYYDALSTSLDERAQAAKNAAVSDLAGKNGLTAAASAPASGVVNIAGGIPAYGSALWQYLKNEVTGDYTPVNYNSPAFSLVHLSRSMQEGGQGYINERYKDNDTARTGLNILYSGVSSGVTNAGQLLLGSKLLGLTSGTLEQFTLGTMSLSAAGQGTYENLRSGQDAGTALANGTMSGLIEYMTETAPIHLWTQNMEKLASGQTARTAKNLMGMFAVRAGSEAWEEVVGNVTEQSWDLLFNGENSAYSSAVRDIIAAKEQQTGRTATAEDWKSARQQAFLDLFVVQSVEAAASAAVSVLLMDGIPITVDTLSDRYAFGTAGRDIRRTGGPEAVQREIQKGMLFPEDSPAHQQAERAARIVAKGSLSNQELGRLSFLNGNAVAGLFAEIEGNGSQYAQTRLQEVYREIADYPMDKVTVETIRELLDLSNGAAPSYEDYQRRSPLAQDAQITGLEDLVQRMNALDLDSEGRPLVGYAQAARELKERFPDASPADIQDMYRQYRNDTRTILFDGNRLTRSQFGELLRTANPDLIEAQVDAYFHEAVLDTLDGSDAFRRFTDAADTPVGNMDAASDADAAWNAENADLPFYFGEGREQSANPAQMESEPAENAGQSANSAQMESEPAESAGRSANLAEIRNEAAAEQTEDVEPGLDYSDRVTAEAVKSLDSAAQDAMDTMGKLLGKRIRVANSVQGGIANGEITGNGIVLDRALLEDEKPETLKWKILGHEMTHGIQQDAPEAYARFREAAAREEAVQEHARQIRELYRMRGMDITEADALDEAAADYGGDIMADTDAAARFIERNRQDKPLLTRIRDAIARLIRKLTGAEKRQLQTVRGLYDAALDAAAKSVREGTAPKTETSGKHQGNSDVTTGTARDGIMNRARTAHSDTEDGRTRYAAKPDTLVPQIRNAIPQMRDMEAVANLNGDEIPAGDRIVDRLVSFVNSFGSKVNRPGFGEVLFSRSKIKTGTVGHGVSQAKIDVFAAVPAVIRDGIQIGYVENYEGRGYDTYVFSAPVNYKGERTYLGVVVSKSGNDSRYYVHEVVDSTGNMIFRENSKEAASDGRATPKGTFDTVATSKDSIAEPGAESKGKLSLKGTEDAATARKMERLVKENQKLKEDVAKWQRKQRAEKSLANARKNVVIGEVNRFADSFLPRWYATLDVKEVRPDLLKLMNLLKAGPQGDANTPAAALTSYYWQWQNALEQQGREIAAKVVESAVTEKEDPALETLRAVRAELRQARISYEDMREMYPDSKDFNAWRQRNQFRMGLRKEGKSIDTYWKGWGEQYGYDLFPSDIYHPTDMLLHLEGLLDSAEPTYENPFDQFETLEVVEDCKNDLISRAMEFMARENVPMDERQAIRDAARQEERTKIGKELEKARQAVLDERAKGEARLKAWKEQTRDHRQAREAAQEDKKVWTQLNRLMSRLNNKKMLQRDRAVLNSIFQELDGIAQGSLGISAEAVYANQMRLWELLDENSPHYDEDFVRNPRIFTVSGQVSLQETLGQKKLTPAEMKELKDRTAEMSVEELQRVAQFLQALDTAQRNIDHMIRSEDRRNLNEMADTAISQARTARKFAAGGIVTEMLRPVSFARRISGFARNSPFVNAVKELSNGERVRDDYRRRAENYILDRFARNLGLGEAWNSRNAKQRSEAVKKVREVLLSFGAKEGAKQENLIKITGTDSATKQLTDAWITRGMRAAIWMHSLNRDNLNHLQWGGVRLPSQEGYELYRKGKFKQAYGEGSVVIRLSKNQVQEITSHMTREELALANAVADYYDHMSKKELTAVHEALKGWSPFNVEHYMPIETDAMFNHTDYEAVNRDGTMNTPGFSRERVPFAGNPIILRDLNLVAESSVSQHAKFIGLGIPIRNMNKLLNRNRVIVEDETAAVRSAFNSEDAARIEERAKQLISTGRADENNALRLAVREVKGSEGVDALRQFQTEEMPDAGDGDSAAVPEYRSVKDAIQRQFGDKAIGYLEKLMRDLVSPKRASSPIWETFQTLTSNYAAATLTLSGSVAPVQTASYPTAAAVIGWTPLLKALKDLPGTVRGRTDTELMNAYTSRFWERAQGFATHEADMLKGDPGGIVNRFKAANWIQGMDVGTTALLWKACEYSVEAAQPELAKDKGSRKEILAGDSAFYQAVAEVYNRVIEETQPSYGTMERPQILRSDHDMVRLTNMFKTQMYQNFNILYDAFGELGARQREYAGNQNEETKAGLDAAWVNVRNAATGLAFAQFLASFIKFLFNRITGNDDKYRDAEGDLTFLSQLKGIALGIVSTIPGMVAYGSEVYSGLAYTVDNALLKGLGLDPFFNEAFYGVTFQAGESLTKSWKYTTSAMKEIVSTFHGVAQGLDEEGNGYHVNWQELTGKTWKAARELLMLGGIPARNAEKLLTGFARIGTSLVLGSTGGEYALLHLSADPQENAGQYYDLLFRAGGRKLYPDPEKAPEEYRNLYQRMTEDGFDADAIQKAMRDKYLKTREYQSAYAEKRSALAKEATGLPGYKLLRDRGKLSDAMDTAAKYAVLSTSIDGYKAGENEGWIEKYTDFGKKYQVSIAPLLLIRAGTSGVSSLPNKDGKAITYSEGLQKMELAYQLYPELNNWPESRRTEFFLLLNNVRETIAGWTKDEVQNGKTVDGKHKSGLNEMRQIAKS
ncbi:MAG: hypothetical protein IJT94_12265 [Oscillibacter sp.]|nr:hypothetical protein [Oscillibacter sp.]